VAITNQPWTGSSRSRAKTWSRKDERFVEKAASGYLIYDFLDKAASGYLIYDLDKLQLVPLNICLIF
jgi:hypothetical protein